MWPVMQAVLLGEDTLIQAASTSEEVAMRYWFGPGISSFVAEESGRILGMYRVLANQPDLRSHVANASFVVDPAAQGRGIGRALGLACLEQAKEMGFLAMQFNFVVSTNRSAVRLWKSLGFEVIGTSPKAFRHKSLGLVDALILHRFL
jgi:GNAT superfamily N-acetyltransferase